MARYFLVAGEASGDLHGAGLVQALLQQEPDAEIVCWGGDLMENAGAKVLTHYSELAVMGFVDVLKALPRILKLLKKCKKQIAAFNPNVLILIDYPGFNLRLATWAKSSHFTVCYYISPKVWAWNTGRVHRIKRDVDLVLSILPFEVEFFSRYQVPVTYVGNPLLDNVTAFAPNTNFVHQQNLQNLPIVALLPGSRKQELRFVLQPMLEALDHRPQWQAVVACAPSLNDEAYLPYKIAFPKVVFLRENTYNLLHFAQAALVCSGTATLEAALLNCPQVVCYKGDNISAFIARMVIKVPFISLVNLIANKEVVKELLQEQLIPTHILAELDAICDQKGAKSMKSEYEALRARMGEPGVRHRAAAAIVALNKKNSLHQQR